MNVEDIKAGRAYVTADDKADMVVDTIEKGVVTYRYYWDGKIHTTTLPLDEFAAWVEYEEDPAATTVVQSQI